MIVRDRGGIAAVGRGRVGQLDEPALRRLVDQVRGANECLKSPDLLTDE